MLQHVFLVYLCLIFSTIVTQATPLNGPPKVKGTPNAKGPPNVPFLKFCGSRPFINDNSIQSCAFRKNGQCKKIMFVITTLANASGVGIHISSTRKSQRPSSYCFIYTKSKQATLRCVQHKSTTEPEVFTVRLGDIKYIDSITIAISRGMLRATVNTYTVTFQRNGKGKLITKKKEAVPFIIVATIPIDFCSSDTLYYRVVDGIYPFNVGERKKIKKQTGYGYMVATFLQGH